MDKNHQIYELSDSEFLSFLYAERDREFSKFSSWGVNFWVAGVAIIGLLGYAYSQISIDYDTFKWHLFVLYSTVLGALLLSLVTIVHPLLINDRWSNKYRVTTVRANVQSTEILGKLYIAISSIMYISYLNEKNEVFWLWCVVCGVEFAIWLYVSVYGDKLIRMKRIGHIFDVIWKECAYRGIECGLCLAIFCVALKTWGHQYPFAAKEFEMGCVFAIFCGIIWFTMFRIFDKRHDSIDWWIDQYIYGTLTKEEVYLYMLQYTQGYDIVEIIRPDLEKIQSIKNRMKYFSEIHKRYLDLPKNRQLNHVECYKYIDDLMKENAMLGEAREVIEHLSGRFKEIMILDSDISEDVMNMLMTELNKFTEEYELFQKEADRVINALNEFVHSFECTKYGGLCSKLDCPHRNEKKSIWYVMKHKLSTIKIRI